MLRAQLPGTLANSAQLALGVDRDGKLRETDPEARQAAADLLVNYGFATRPELRTLSLPALVERIHDRLRERGVEPKPQA